MTAHLPTILVVDDEHINTMLLTAALRRLGYSRIVVAHDGRSAVSAVRAGDIDFVFMDLMMPGVSGAEATAQIRTFSNVPVIVISAADKALAGEVVQAGANKFMSKPFEREAIRLVLLEYGVPPDAVSP